MIDNTLGVPSADPADREAAINRFASACTGEYELAHGRQVARLAGRIFEQIAEQFHLNSDDRPLLEAAARLQDVGYLINYDQHHKHSYHLILNSRLAGFRPRELELIANIARYHRGARPKQKHANFRQLPPDDQKRVEQLAAILRLAGGLDRSHSQQISDVTLSPRDQHDAKGIDLLVHAEFNPEVDLWGARRRTKLFKRVFGTKLNVNWAAGSADETTSTDLKTADKSPAGSQAHGLQPVGLSAPKISNGVAHRNGASGGAKQTNGRSPKSSRKSRELER
jgi:exopolyphosphatase / guanosine-5'-triphosphate,3'-diphosphate pyrophosphatase